MRLIIATLSLMCLTLGFAQAHIVDQAQRDAFIEKDVLKMKAACDDKLRKGDSGVTVEMREASQESMECLHDMTLKVADALYQKKDIESWKLETELGQIQDNMLDVFGLTDQLALYCGPGADEGCSYNGGTMYQITPYGRVLDFYEGVIMSMCSMSISDSSKLKSAEWTKRFHRHADEVGER